ncbi:hypothetical protein KY308_03390 [Candidatus Woesearchaeota archaeon]|nr:hypothetical protein [Candidatus Woesearchaeota archaeon]
MVKKSLREKLLEKGWKEDEIEHALSIIKPSESKSQIFIQRTNPILYWSALIISIIGNFLIAVALIPFLLVLSSFQLYIVIAVLAISFGAMFNLLINTIEALDPAHHVIAGVFIPALAVITIFVMVNVANRLSFVLESPIHQNPIFVSFAYVVAFVLPYAYTKFTDFLGQRRPASPA